MNGRGLRNLYTPEGWGPWPGALAAPGVMETPGYEPSPHRGAALYLSLFSRGCRLPLSRCLPLTLAELMSRRPMSPPTRPLPNNWRLRAARCLAVRPPFDLPGDVVQPACALGRCHLHELLPHRRRHGDQHSLLHRRDLRRHMVARQRLGPQQLRTKPRYHGRTSHHQHVVRHRRVGNDRTHIATSARQYPNSSTSQRWPGGSCKSPDRANWVTEFEISTLYFGLRIPGFPFPVTLSHHPPPFVEQRQQRVAKTSTQCARAIVIGGPPEIRRICLNRPV
jgi:hypothetical protein